MAHTDNAQARRQQEAIEQLAGDEWWRDGLNDDEANVLMNWGIAQVKRIVPNGQASGKVRALHAEEEDQEETVNHWMRQLRYCPVILVSVSRFCGCTARRRTTKPGNTNRWSRSGANRIAVSSSSGLPLARNVTELGGTATGLMTISKASRRSLRT